jgi:GrpB-like predicted nucleotidyltransferase (UPF0157 family)
MEEPPVDLRPIEDVRAVADEVVASFRAAIAGEVPGGLHHIGATAMPAGHTKGDVDVNLRVPPDEYATAVRSLRDRYPVAQPENWTAGFASFSCEDYALPLGIQVTRIGSPDDFLLALNERLQRNPELAHRYDEVKFRAAPRGRTAYWEAKNAFLQELLAGDR